MDSLPVSFGKPQQSNKQNHFKQLERLQKSKRVQQDDEQQPLASTSNSILVDQLTSDNDDDDDDDDDQQQHQQQQQQQDTSTDLPISHELILKDHVKTVSALSLDPAGARIASGSYDYDVKLWDFGGMTSVNVKPFRSFEPLDGHQVIDIQFSPKGDSFLVIAGSNQPKLYDRDGIELGTFAKGDMYISDLRKTEGHVSSITSCTFSPKSATTFLTASTDSTLRIWDTSDRRKSKQVIVVKSKERGGKTKVTACAWSPDGRWIAAACEDGTVLTWEAKGNFARPYSTAENAHEKGTITGSVVFSPDSKLLASRGGDGTLKLWNPKSLKKPIAAYSTNLATLNGETNVAFSPDGKYVVTGTAGDGLTAKGRGGKLVVLRTEGLGLVKELEISLSSVVKVFWHPKINHIITGSSDGTLHALYSPLLSTKGATMVITKGPKRRQVDDWDLATSGGASDVPLQSQIVAPHSLPMFRDDNDPRNAAGKRRREKERHDPQKTMKPLPPVVGPGKGGRIGAAATQHVVQGLVRDDLRTQDPREALLKYAVSDVTENEWTAAWTKTQPKPVFDLRQEPEEEDNDQKKKKRK
ncbi:WD40 repeat-like protein [Meredithblackwellia eburnea MCA 4105]